MTDPWFPEHFWRPFAFGFVRGMVTVIIVTVMFPVLYERYRPMPTTESPGRIYWTENQNLVQEITKIHTDGNGEVIKTEVFLEYVGVLPPEKQIRLRSHDKAELVKDLTVPGAKLRK